MPSNELAFLPATELLARYRAKTLSPVEATEQALRRLETYEGALNAFVLYDPDSALAAARASEARWAKGAPQGLLDGVPVAIKDTQLTRGWPRLVGSKTIDPNQRWHEDAPATARLRSRFHGLRVTPLSGESVVGFQPNSGVVVLPIKTGFCARSRAVAGASSCQR